MRKYQQLTIVHAKDQLIELLNELKSAKGIFSYKRNKSIEYAKNIFHTEDTVGCFYTDRVTLNKSTVWVVITGDEMKVTNITPGTVSSLGIVRYNMVLNTFFHDFLKKYLDNTWESSVSMTGEYVTLADMMSLETYQALERWERNCNRVSPNINESDERLWFEFVRLLHNENVDLNVEDFAQWLTEDRGWHSELSDVIADLELKLEYSLSLLSYYDANN